MRVLKRRWDVSGASQGAPAQPSSPTAQPQKRLFKKPRSPGLLRRRGPCLRYRKSDMTDPVEYIQTHEEAFKNPNRLASLYSDFRAQQHINPDGYVANLDAWKRALEHAAREGLLPGSGATRNLLVIDSGRELTRALQHRDFGLPTCLREVLQDAIKKGAFVSAQDWLTSTQSIYDKSWFKLPKVSVGGVLSGAWELGRNKLLGPSTQLPAGPFVVVANVEAAAEAILNQQRDQPNVSIADRIYSKAAFLERFRNVLNLNAPISARDLDILLVHMARDRHELAVKGNVIKFKADAEDLPLPVTQEDAAMAELHDAINRVQARLALLHENIQKSGMAAKEAVQLKQLTRAKTCLRSKKLSESSAEHYTNLSVQLEESYMKLQHAADHVGMLEAMKAGAEAMALLNKQVGGAEGVQKVMDSVNEEIATTEEITNIINESATPIDETEIDDELAELEKGEDEKHEKVEAEKTAELLAELPDTKKPLRSPVSCLTSPSRQLSRKRTRSGLEFLLSYLGFHFESIRLMLRHPGHVRHAAIRQVTSWGMMIKNWSGIVQASHLDNDATFYLDKDFHGPRIRVYDRDLLHNSTPPSRLGAHHDSHISTHRTPHTYPRDPMPSLAPFRAAARTSTVVATRQPNLKFPLSFRRTFTQTKSAQGGHGPSYDPPSGWLFGVKPGEKYQKEGWEGVWYWGFYGSFAVAIVAYAFKPDTSIQTWALEEARRRLEAEGILQDPDTKE
ncbi:snf7 family protein [Paraphaeosphaeria sporulosa]